MRWISVCYLLSFVIWLICPQSSNVMVSDHIDISFQQKIWFMQAQQKKLITEKVTIYIFEVIWESMDAFKKLWDFFKDAYAFGYWFNLNICLFTMRYFIIDAFTIFIIFLMWNVNNMDIFYLYFVIRQFLSWVLSIWSLIGHYERFGLMEAGVSRKK